MDIFKIVEELTSNYSSPQVYQHRASKQLMLLRAHRGQAENLRCSEEHADP